MSKIMKQLKCGKCKKERKEIVFYVFVETKDKDTRKETQHYQCPKCKDKTVIHPNLLADIFSV